MCFGGNRCAWSIGDTKQELCTAASRSDAGKCCVKERVWVLVPRPLNCRERCLLHRWVGGAEIVAHLFRGQLGCLNHRRHPAAALR